MGQDPGRNHEIEVRIARRRRAARTSIAIGLVALLAPVAGCSSSAPRAEARCGPAVRRLAGALASTKQIDARSRAVVLGSLRSCSGAQAWLERASAVELPSVVEDASGNAADVSLDDALNLFCTRFDARGSTAPCREAAAGRGAG
jgi:hypothetical protein